MGGGKYTNNAYLGRMVELILGDAKTPLHLDPTHTESLNHLSHWAKTIAAAFPK